MVSPRPGPHKKFESIPLQIILRDILKVVGTAKEVKLILQAREVLVDQEPRKDFAYPAGIFDVVSIPKTGKNYRIVPTNHGLELLEISEKESKLKICRIRNKTVLKKGKLQLNLHDGRNILVGKDEYKTGDSILIEIPSNKIVEHLPLAENCLGIVSKGTDSGKIGKVKEVVKGGMREKARIICDLDGVKEEVLKERFFVLGKNKPVIKVGNVGEQFG